MVAGVRGSPNSAHLAVYMRQGGTSFEEELLQASFVPSGGRDAARIATVISAFAQPVRRSLPSLLLEGLGPQHHLIVWRSMPHPFQAPPVSSRCVKYAIDFAEGDVGVCIRSREKLADAIVRLSKVLVN